MKINIFISIFLMMVLPACKSSVRSNAAPNLSSAKGLNTQFTYIPNSIHQFQFRKGPQENWGPLRPDMVANKTGDEGYACPNCFQPGPEDSYGPMIQIMIDGGQYEAQVKIRGGLTIMYPKKSFTIKFKKGGPFPRIHGAEKRKIVLNASYNDPTFLRQFIVFSSVIMQDGYAPFVDFVDVPIAGDFSAANKGRVNDPERTRLAFYLILEDWQLASEDVAGKDAKVFKSESDCAWGSCQAGNFESEPSQEIVGEIVNLQNMHCAGQDVIDRSSYFRWLYINHFFKDQDSITKNYILFQNPSRGNKLFFFHWDQDATFGFSPDGSFYGDATEIFTPEPWGRKNNPNDTWQTACFRDEWKNDYLAQYRDAVQNRGLNAQEFLVWLNGTGVKSLVQAPADRDRKEWAPHPESRQPDDWATEMHRLEQFFVNISNTNRARLGL